MTTGTTSSSVTVEEMTPAQGRSMFEALCRDRLGISREEFLRRLDDGDYGESDAEDVVRLTVLAPFAR